MISTRLSLGEVELRVNRHLLLGCTRFLRERNRNGVKLRHLHRCHDDVVLQLEKLNRSVNVLCLKSDLSISA